MFSSEFSIFFCRTACGDGDFKCGNGYCIPASKKCDRTHDCQDGSDERDCNYGLTSFKFFIQIHPVEIISLDFCEGRG